MDLVDSAHDEFAFTQTSTIV